MDDNGMVGWFFGLACGLLLGIAAGIAITGNGWQEWAIEQGYAHYDAKTGELVYEKE